MTIAYRGHISTMILLITQGAEVDCQDTRCITPLQTASVNNGNTDPVAYLIYKKAKINQQNKFGMTALHYAIKNHASKNAYLLMEHGGQLDIQDKKGETPRELGKKSASEDIVEVIRFVEQEVMM